MLPGLNMPNGAPDDGRARTQSLYRSHRPTTFAADELVGQEHVTRTLRNAIAHGRVAHAYLFCGTRGTGKTSTARLLAKAVNCLDPDVAARPCNVCDACRAINNGSATDIVEIDAASNRGIDDIRALREQARFAPAQLHTKFYILDEAHRLSKEAFDALLKTLEEPPPRTVFILATTEIEKLPATIASRCQRFDFRRIPLPQMVARVRLVCEREGIQLDDEALALVTRQATGSLRDALSLVDLLATAAAEQDGRIDGALARRMLGLSHDDRAIALLEALAERDVAKGLQTIADAVDAGLEMRAFGRQTLGLLRTLMLVRAGANPPEADDTTRALAERFELLDLLRINRHFADQDLAIRNGGFPQLPLELALVAAIVEPEAAVAPALAAPAPERAPSRPRPTLVETPRSDAWRERPAERRREPERPSERPRETPAPPPAREPTPLRRPQPAVTAGGDALAGIVAQWERVRTEVKALDRKVEALLASTDPGAFDGRQLTLISAYPFHASKLNDPRARQYVEQAVERILGSPVTVTTVVRDEFAPPPTAAAPRAAASAPEPVIEEDFAPYAPANPADDPDEALVRVVKTMFDAEEVDPDEP